MVQTIEKHQLYINGEWVDPVSGEYYEVISPVTGKVVAKAAYGNGSDAKRAIEASYAAFSEWSAMTARDRAVILMKIYQLMQDRLEELAQKISAEMGKPIREARMEARQAAEYVLWNAEEAKRAYGETIPTSIKNKRLKTIRQPIGPVAAISTWNFPLAMVTRKVAPALAAGCTVVLKSASQTPGSAVQFLKIAEQAGLPKGVINLVSGSASKIGDALLTDKRIRKVTFTGSTEVGKQLLRKAADQVKRVSMELGGHAPLIVFEDADLEKAVTGVIANKFRNTGQTCICANRVYVQESIKEKFLALFKEKVEAIKIGNGLEEHVELGPVVNEGSLQKIKEHVEDAVHKGATLVTGGKKCVVKGFECGYFYEPTILADVKESMLISYEETFGPVAPVFSFQTEEEVIQKANDTDYGLASYFFTQDLSRATRVSEALEYGMVGINDDALAAVQGPFGGVKESGIGREGGPDSLADFLETKFISTVI